MLGVADRNTIDGAAARLLPFPGQDDNYTVIEAVKEFLNAKARAGRSDRHGQNF
jgi:hypothetical protein